MPVFRIHRMKDTPRQQFRSAAHVSGIASVKPKDYEAAGETNAENEYAAWALLRHTEHPLNVGDLLESDRGGMRICKYVGFEEARWLLPEPQQASLPAAAAVEVSGPVSDPPPAPVDTVSQTAQA